MTAQSVLVLREWTKGMGFEMTLKVDGVDNVLLDHNEELELHGLHHARLLWRQAGSPRLHRNSITHTSVCHQPTLASASHDEYPPTQQLGV